MVAGMLSLAFLWLCRLAPQHQRHDVELHRLPRPPSSIHSHAHFITYCVHFGLHDWSADCMYPSGTIRSGSPLLAAYNPMCNRRQFRTLYVKVSSMIRVRATVAFHRDVSILPDRPRGRLIKFSPRPTDSHRDAWHARIPSYNS